MKLKEKCPCDILEGIGSSQFVSRFLSNSGPVLLVTTVGMIKRGCVSTFSEQLKDVVTVCTVSSNPDLS